VTDAADKIAKLERECAELKRELAAVEGERRRWEAAFFKRANQHDRLKEKEGPRGATEM